MRLIDAEIFKKNMDYICDAGGWLEPVTKAVREFVKRHIDGQTVVDAIPIDWIEKWLERYSYRNYRREIIEFMVTEWKHEQEKQNEQKTD